MRNRNQLDECLRSLPRDLDETYERILCSIPHEYVDDVHRVLTLLCFSARPLTIYELIDAHAVDLLNEPPRLDRDGRSYEQHDLVDICLGLVEVVVTKDASAKKEQTLIARIAHFSVQEYLQSERILQQGSKSFAMQSAPANKEIAHICLVYLLEPSLSAGIFDVANTSLHFAHFAARHWFDHYAGSEEGQADVEPLVLELLAENRAAFVTWIKLHDMDQTLNMKKKNRLYTGPESAIAESLYYAALLGLEFVIHSLLKCDIEDTRKASDAINTHLGFCGNALQAASANGHEKVVKLLLDKGANINAQGGVYGNSLQAASANGHEKVVKLLLDKHAYINIRGGQYHSALQAALVRNHKRVVQLLLDKGANTNAQGGYYGSALQTAVIHCDEEVVQLLLDKGANVNTQAGHSGNALQAASVTGKIVLLQMLLDKGANINAQGGNHGNALQAALARGHRSAVQLLLDKGANIHAQGGVYGNILQAAAFNADEKVVQMLLDKGANINAQCGAYGNALQAASATGNAILLQMMLDKGANINAQGGFYGNALEAALKNGHKILVQKLVEGGADLDFKDSKNGRTSLVRMVIGGYPVINKPSLWINKVGLDVKDNCGRGPFFYAAWYGYATFVGAILTADDVDPDRKDHYGLTPLSVAVRHGHTEIVKMLLATGSVTCDSRDCFGRSVSWWAKRMGNPDVQELLADHSKIRGIPIFDENFDEWSAPNRPIRRCCDCCTLDISKDTVYYRCNICDGGDFDVCITCYELEGRCLQDGHYMFRKGNDGVLD